MSPKRAQRIPKNSVDGRRAKRGPATANLSTKINYGFQRVKFEPGNLSRDNLSGEIGRTPSFHREFTKGGLVKGVCNLCVIILVLLLNPLY